MSWQTWWVSLSYYKQRKWHWRQKINDRNVKVRRLTVYYLVILRKTDRAVFSRTRTQQVIEVIHTHDSFIQSGVIPYLCSQASQARCPGEAGICKDVAPLSRVRKVPPYLQGGRTESWAGDQRLGGFRTYSSWFRSLAAYFSFGRGCVVPSIPHTLVLHVNIDRYRYINILLLLLPPYST